MLAAFRKFGETSFVKYGLILLALSFVTWGIGDYLQGGSNSVAAKVGDKEITINEVYNAYQLKKNEFSRLTQNTITDEMAQQMGLPNIVLGELIREEMIQSEISNLGLVASDATIGASIRSMSIFQNDNDEFDKSLYLQQLRTSGLSASSFETNLKKEQVSKLFYAHFQPMISEAWAKRMAQIDATQFDVTIVPVTANALPALPAPTQQELEEFYQAHATQYTTPEKRSFEYITLSTAATIDAQTVSEDEIKAYYENYQADFMTPETRNVFQYVASDKSKVKEMREKKMARKSLDDKKKSLGTVTEKDLPKDISYVVFSLEEGEVSDIVETPFGHAFMWVENISKPKALPLEDVKDQIDETLKASKGEEAFDDTLANIEDQIAAGQTLSQIAAENKLIAFKDISDVDMANTEEASDIMQVAFEIDEGEISDPIEETTNDAFKVSFLSVTHVDSATLPALKTQETQVRKDFIAQRNEARIAKTLNTLKSAPLSELNNNIKTLKLKVTPQRLRHQNKEALTKAGFTPQAAISMLALEENSALPQTILYKGNPSAVFMRARHTGEPDGETVASMKEGITQTLQNELLQQLLTSLQNRMDIKIYEPQLNQAFNIQ